MSNFNHLITISWRDSVADANQTLPSAHLSFSCPQPLTTLSHSHSSIALLTLREMSAHSSEIVVGVDFGTT